MMRRTVLSGRGITGPAAVCGLLVFLCAGCYFEQQKYELSHFVTAPLPPGGRLTAETHNGGIAAAGDEQALCRLTTRVTGYAPTVEEAQRLAELVRVSIVELDGALATRIDKPHIPSRCGLAVSFEISVPRQTGLDLQTHNGAIRIVDITGAVRARTHNGELRAERVAGTLNLESYNGRVCAEDVIGLANLTTHNGHIICREMMGPLTARTHNGKVEVFYGDSADGAVESRIVTYNGDIAFVGPPGLSAKTNVQTHNGSVKTAVPIVVQGEIDKRRLVGTIGSGEGTLHLQTHNGSISLR